MVKSWLDCNNLHNSTEYIFFMVGNSTRNLPILFTSLFIDIIFALHYGFIFHLSDAVFTAIDPSA